jgi:alpha-N-arabinofuranosidase
VEGPGYVSKFYGQVTYIDSSAILNGDQLHVFLTNRSVDQSAVVEVGLADRVIVGFGNAEVLTGPDAKAANTFENPGVVQAHPFSEVQIAQGQASLELPPLSVAAVTFLTS